MTTRFANLATMLAVLAMIASSTAAQEHVNINPATVKDHLSQAAAAAHGQPAPPSIAPASAKVPVANPPAEPLVNQAVPVPDRGVRRDPFGSLVNKKSGGSDVPENLPPGKPGLIIGSLRIDGITKAVNGMIAIVSNPQQRVYFIREGDKLYDGNVGNITLEGVSFHERSKDAFGRPIERDVTKRLYPSPGEQQ